MFEPQPLTSVLQPLGTRSPKETRLSRWEYLLAVVVFGVLAFLRLRYVTALKINADEPQHLHVTWAWTQGLVQYRDIFDNHTPLFQMLFSPLVGWLGERPDIMHPMRLAMIPLTIGVLACVGWIGGRLYSARVGLWSALFVGLSPFYLLISSEYRTDNLWGLVWMLALVFLFTGRLGRGRSFVSGLLIGAAFCVSMKTLLLVLGLLVGALVVFGCRLLAPDEPELGRRLARNTGFGFLGFLVVPSILFAYFAGQGALGALYYCVFEHNLVPGLERYSFDRWNFPLLFPLILIIGWFVYRAARSTGLATRRTILWIAGATTFLVLMSYWPMVTRQDFAAIAPYLGISLGAGVMSFSGWLYGAWVERVRGRFSRMLALLVALVIPAGVAAYEVERSLNIWGLDHDAVGGFAHSLKTRLSMTKPGDYVMDSKGEIIFRRRPFYYVLEGVTLFRIEHGYTKDTIEEDCHRTNTCMVVMGRMPDWTEEWVERDYVPLLKGIWVAGGFLREAEGGGYGRPFRVARSARYKFVSPDGPVHGSINGVPVSVEEGIDLSPGEYIFETAVTGPAAAVWAQAVDQGNTPFNIPAKAPKDPNKKKKKIPTNPFS